LDELTASEAVELGQLIRNTTSAIKTVTGCLKTYVIQFAESPDHPHVHFHIIPRMADLPENDRSIQIFKYLGVPEEKRVSEEAMDAIAGKVRELLLAKTAA
jgi:diadenosine tetraphosphate (Ap4A) HIT family hydrolase